MSLDSLAEEWGRLHLSVTPATPLAEVKRISLYLNVVWDEAGRLAGSEGQTRLLEILDELSGKRRRKKRMIG